MSTTDSRLDGKEQVLASGRVRMPRLGHLIDGNTRRQGLLVLGHRGSGRSAGLHVVLERQLNENLSERLRRMLHDLELRDAGNDRSLLRETLRLLRDELRQREEEYHRTDDRYQLAVNAARIGVWDWNLATGQISWNRHHAKIFGMASFQCQGDYEAFLRCIHLDDRGVLREAIDLVRDQRLHLDHTYRVCWPDGTIRWVRSHGGCHYDADGKAVRMTGTVMDITDQVQWRQLVESEAKARARAEELSVVLEAVPAITFLAHDRECRRISSSRATRELLRVPEGFSVSKSAPEEQRPTSFRVMKEGREVATEDLPVQKAARSGIEVRDVELTIVFEDGTNRDIFGHAVPLFDEAGVVRGAVGAFSDVTERRRAEKALRESEERLRMALEAGRMGTWDWNIAGGTNEWNDELYRQLGYTPGSVKSSYEAWTERVLPEDLANAETQVRESLKRGGSYRCEYRVRGANGQVRWLEGRGRSECDENGNAIRTYGVVIDITTERNAAEALRASEAFVRGVLDSLPQHVAVLDGLGVIRAVNKTWIDFSNQNGGSASSVCVGANYLGACRRSSAAGDSIARDVVELLEALLSGRRNEFSLEYPCDAPGLERWFLMHAQRVVHGPPGIIITHINITERKQAEKAVQVSESRLRLAVSATRAMVYDFDPRTKRVIAMNGLPELLGYELSEVEMTLEWWDRHIDAKDQVEWHAALRRMLANPQNQTLRYHVRHKDGRMLFVEDKAVPVCDGSGKVARIVGTVVDITDASRAEDELRSARLIAEEARATAEAASHAKDHFLAVLSHELRTPLMPVLAATEMLEAGKALSAEQAEIVQMIRRNVELETRLIDDLLDVTRISRNKLELHMSTLDVHKEIAYAVEVCRQDAAAKLLSVEIELNAKNHHLKGDPARFQQIIWNLLKNAIKFTPASGRITIRTANRPGGTIVIEVIDSGVGIDPMALPLIFDAFEQGDREVTRRFGGLGLGLSISKVLVELHGGRIKAASEGKGKGATFTVEMPFCAQAEPTREVSDAGDLDQLNCTILLVEDHPDTRRVMEWLLRQLGCEVQTAATVGEAIEVAGKHDFDLVISDIGLPDETGMVLMRQLKVLYGLKGIALSGYGTDRDVSNSKEAGFDVHLTKPVNLQVLEEAVRRLTVLR